MRHPFSNSHELFAQRPLPRVTTHTTAGSLGGVAPQGVTIGVRRDFGFTPQFLPRMLIAGGLKQPPRG